MNGIYSLFIFEYLKIMLVTHFIFKIAKLLGGIHMKGMYRVVILLLIIVLLSACQQEGVNIKTSSLSESEKELIRSVGVDKYFAFDIDIYNAEFKELEYRVDYYEKGEFIKVLSNGIDPRDLLKENKQRLIWSQIKTGKNQDELWTIYFSGSRITQQIAIPENIKGMSWGKNEYSNTINSEEEVILAVIVGTESGSIRGSGVIFNKEDGGIDSLKHYDVAYVLTLNLN